MAPLDAVTARPGVAVSLAALAGARSALDWSSRVAAAFGGATNARVRSARRGTWADDRLTRTATLSMNLTMRLCDEEEEEEERARCPAAAEG